MRVRAKVLFLATVIQGLSVTYASVASAAGLVPAPAPNAQPTVAPFPNRMPLPAPTSTATLPVYPAPTATAKLNDPIETRIEEKAGGKKLLVNTDQGWIEFADVVVMPKGARLYTWGGDDPIARWLSQGHVDGGEVGYLTSTGQGAAGGGVYASADPFNSMSYGPRVAVFELQKDAVVLDGITRKFKFSTDPYPLLIPALQKQGIQAIKGYYVDEQSSWMNVISSEMLSAVHEGSARELLDALSPHRSAPTLQMVLGLDQRYPISPSHPVIEKNFPALSKLLSSRMLSPEEIAQLSKPESIDVLLEATRSSFLQSRGWLSRSAIELLKKPIIERFQSIARDAVAHVESPFSPESDALKKFSDAIQVTGRIGIPLEEWLPYSRSGTQLFDHGVDSSKVLPQQEFGKKIAAAFELMDPRELLSALAHGDSEPWKRAQIPGAAPVLDQWRGIAPLSLLRPFYYALSRGIDQKELKTRDQPLSSSGEILIDGKSYSAMTENQKVWLERNPFLLVESIEAQGKAADGQRLFLVRYEHPSASNFEHFSPLLSPVTLKRLRGAEQKGQLRDIESSEFRSLTLEMLNDLADNTTRIPDWSKGAALRRYQLWMGLHPLNTGNAEAARWLLQGSAFSTNNPASGVPSWGGSLRMHPALLDWERDWTLPYPDLVTKADEGARQYQNILAGLRRAEQQSPDFPRYFDVPELWEVGLQQRATPGQEARFVEQAKARFKAGVLPDSTLINPCAAAYRGIGH